MFWQFSFENNQIRRWKSDIATRHVDEVSSNFHSNILQWKILFGSFEISQSASCTVIRFCVAEKSISTKFLFSGIHRLDFKRLHLQLLLLQNIFWMSSISILKSLNSIQFQVKNQ